MVLFLVGAMLRTEALMAYTNSMAGVAYIFENGGLDTLRLATAYHLYVSK